jgi:hypothetical protein
MMHAELRGTHQSSSGSPDWGLDIKILKMLSAEEQVKGKGKVVPVLH